jgi:hypothetical protein
MRLEKRIGPLEGHSREQRTRVLAEIEESARELKVQVRRGETVEEALVDLRSLGNYITLATAKRLGLSTEPIQPYSLIELEETHMTTV